MKHDLNSVDLDLMNDGNATQILFEPQIPLGAHVLGAEYRGHPIKVETEAFPEDEHAGMTLDVPHGESHCHLRFQGGVSITLDQPDLHPGDPSTALKLTRLQLQGQTLSMDADIHPSGNATFHIQTPWKITGHEGATVLLLGDNRYQIDMDRAPNTETPASYSHTRVKLTFSRQ
jgi:hypothetical protein